MLTLTAVRGQGASWPQDKGVVDAEAFGRIPVRIELSDELSGVANSLVDVDDSGSIRSSELDRSRRSSKVCII